MQLGTYSRRPSKFFVKDDSAAIGATMARNKDVGSMVKAASWSDFGICGSKPAVGNKTAPGSEPGPKEERKAEVISKADAVNNETAGCFTGEIGVTKADAGNQEGARSITAEIGVAKVEPGNKETAGSFNGEIGAAGKGVITEADWINFVFLIKPPGGIEWKAEATGINKERVPDSFIDILKKRPLHKKIPPPVSKIPELREVYLPIMTQYNHYIDLHADILRQLKQKEFAEVGVDFTDGVKKLFIIPQH